jgi:chemotaxis signal transduction protein
MILDVSMGLVALVVDAVLDVFSSAENPLRVVPVLDEKHRHHGIKAAYRHDDRLAFLLDADRLAEPAVEVSREAGSLVSSEAP